LISYKPCPLVFIQLHLADFPAILKNKELARRSSDGVVYVFLSKKIPFLGNVYAGYWIVRDAFAGLSETRIDSLGWIIVCSLPASPVVDLSPRLDWFLKFSRFEDFILEIRRNDGVEGNRFKRTKYSLAMVD